MYRTMPGEGWIQVGCMKKQFAAMVGYRAVRIVLCFFPRHFSCAALRYLDVAVRDDPRLSSASPVGALCRASFTTLFLGSCSVNTRRRP